MASLAVSPSDVQIRLASFLPQLTSIIFLPRGWNVYRRFPCPCLVNVLINNTLLACCQLGSDSRFSLHHVVRIILVPPSN